MKHNVNFGLLGLLLLVLLTMIGLVVYYNWTFESLSRRYDEALGNLANVTRNVNQTQHELVAREALLKEKERILSDYLKELNISKQRETSLGGHYVEMKTTADDLSKNLNQTLVERNKYAAQADKYYADSLDWKGKYDKSTNDLSAANTRISRLKGNSLELENSIGQFNTELTDLENRVKSMKNRADTIHNTCQNCSSTADDLRNDVSGAESTVTALKGIMTRIAAISDAIQGG